MVEPEWRALSTNARHPCLGDVDQAAAMFGNIDCGSNGTRFLM